LESRTDETSSVPTGHATSVECVGEKYEIPCSKRNRVCQMSAQPPPGGVAEMGSERPREHDEREKEADQSKLPGALADAFG
jgi:hypothetical protein